jgi:putative endonuclease
MTSARRQALGVQARRTGRTGEIVAAFWLMAKGWRILAANLRTHGVEIDLLARKGAVLAVVEVKARANLDAALAAVTPDQQARLRRAGLALAARPQSEGLSMRLDLIALAPGRLPRHIPDAWPDVAVWQGVGSRS